MKQIYKNYVFDNFSKNLFKGQTAKNSLEICESFNVFVGDFGIKGLNQFDDYFKQKFDNINEYKAFFNKNEEILQKIIKIYDYEYYDLFDGQNKIRYFCIDENFNFYEMDFSNKNITNFNIRFDEEPNVIKENQMLYFFSGDFVIVVLKDNVPEYFSSVSNTYSYAYIDDFIYYVTKLNPYSIFVREKTELINLLNDYELKIDLDAKDGKILKILNFKNDLYIFQEYKISKYNYSSSKPNIKSACAINCKIIADTIVEFNDSIVMLTTSGLKVFDGNDIKNIFDDFSKFIDFKSEKFNVCVYNEKIYLSLNICYDLKTFSAVAEIDIEKNNIVIFNLGDYLLSLNLFKNSREYNLLVVSKNKNKNCVLINSDKGIENKKFVKFNEIYFDSYRIKKINSIKFNASGKFKFKVKSDEEENEFFVENSMQINNLLLKGHVFEFVIESDFEFLIKSIFIEILTSEDYL